MERVAPSILVKVRCKVVEAVGHVSVIRVVLLVTINLLEDRVKRRDALPASNATPHHLKELFDPLGWVALEELQDGERNGDSNRGCIRASERSVRLTSLGPGKSKIAPRKKKL